VRSRQAAAASPKQVFFLVKGRVGDSDSPNSNLNPRAIFAGERKDSVLYPKDSYLFGIDRL
jgi:hypothetical protein